MRGIIYYGCKRENIWERGIGKWLAKSYRRDAIYLRKDALFIPERYLRYIVGGKKKYNINIRFLRLTTQRFVKAILRPCPKECTVF